MSDMTGPQPVRSRLAREPLLRSLPEDGAAGWTAFARPGESPALEAHTLPRDIARRIDEISGASETGTAVFVYGSTALLIGPPFPVEEARAYSEIYTQPLRELLDRRRVVAAFLLRLGGYTVGVFRDGALVDSKTDRRFVKNRHRKGGQSQRRFDRIREKQTHEHFASACADARETLEPHRDKIEHVFLGGDRLTLHAFRKECTYFDGFGARLMQRVLHVPGDPRRASLDTLPREIWSSDVYSFDIGEL